MALVVKNLPAKAEDIGDTSSILGLERSPGGGHGNLLQDSCLENPMGRGARLATVHEVAKSWTQLNNSYELQTKLIPLGFTQNRDQGEKKEQSVC